MSFTLSIPSDAPMVAELLDKAVWLAGDADASFCLKYFCTKGFALGAISLSLINIPLYILKGFGQSMADLSNFKFKKAAHSLGINLLNVAKSTLIAIALLVCLAVSIIFPSVFKYLPADWKPEDSIEKQLEESQKEQMRLFDEGNSKDLKISQLDHALNKLRTEKQTIERKSEKLNAQIIETKQKHEELTQEVARLQEQLKGSNDDWKRDLSEEGQGQTTPKEEVLDEDFLELAEGNGTLKGALQIGDSKIA